jgi:hypothetical protein
MASLIMPDRFIGEYRLLLRREKISDGNGGFCVYDVYEIGEERSERSTIVRIKSKLEFRLIYPKP